jgi:hypothetical protein
MVTNRSRATPAPILALAACAAVAGYFPAAAADGEAEERTLGIELNALSQEGDACRLVFVVENAMGADLSAAVFETVLFDREGRVVTLTLFDFGALPEGRPRVRQFDLADTRCDDLGRLLLNDAHACHADGTDTQAIITPKICAAALRWSSRTAIEVLG